MQSVKPTMIAMTAIAGLTAAVPASAALVINGGFEANTGTPAGWTVAPGNEIVAVAAGAYGPCCGATGTPAQLSNRIVSFGSGNAANVSTLDQVISTVLGRKYVLTFDFGVFGNGPQTLTANVFNGTSLLASSSQTKNANNNLGTTFSKYSVNFIGAGANTRLSFGVDPVTSSVDGAIDNVAVSAIPEPATWAMMICGFGVVGGAMRRRKTPSVRASA